LRFLHAYLSQMPIPKNLIGEVWLLKMPHLVKVGEGYSFTEGPAVHRNGDVYFTDQPNDKIYKWSATRNDVTLFKEGTKRSNGMYFDRKDVLIVQPRILKTNSLPLMTKERYKSPY
jgi:hypothetical protein